MSIRDKVQGGRRSVTLQFELPEEFDQTTEPLQLTILVSRKENALHLPGASAGAAHHLPEGLPGVVDARKAAKNAQTTAGTYLATSIIQRIQGTWLPAEPVPVVFPPRPPKDELMEAIRNWLKNLGLGHDIG